ncbi:hypothetical protein [Trinickia terrae]|uniref:hypothetical protein n=1 Tax=Trinickia terrae TaxID=2571161 RepID=UPI001F0EC66C|nr:hypothetical protein [Trinickia terrae]
MSIVSFLSLRKRLALARLLAALVPFALPLAAGAQEAADASSVQAASLAVASAWPMLAPLPHSLAATPAVLEFDAAPAMTEDGDALEAGADNGSAVPLDTPQLDDQVLSRQRGGRVGMVMIAATPQLMHGANAVTLWDEIAPPAPLPVPVDQGRSAQGNVASYTRK